jgi:hypothetical protein
VEMWRSLAALLAEVRATYQRHSVGSASTHAITGGWHIRSTPSQTALSAGIEMAVFRGSETAVCRKFFLLRSLSSPEAAFWRKKSGTCQALVDTSSAKVLGVTKPAS